MSGLFKITLIAAVALLVSCSGERGKVPASVVNIPNTAEGSTTDGLPQIQFNQTEHDFGKVIQGERVTYAFKFKNTGDADLVIGSISATCGCTATDYPRTPIKPGEENMIKVTFDSAGKEGFQHKTITVAANTQPSSTVLSIKAMVFTPEKR
jgi:hypothetical protein